MIYACYPVKIYKNKPPKMFKPGGARPARRSWIRLLIICNWLFCECMRIIKTLNTPSPFSLSFDEKTPVYEFFQFAAWSRDHNFHIHHGSICISIYMKQRRFYGFLFSTLTLVDEVDVNNYMYMLEICLTFHNRVFKCFLVYIFLVYNSDTKYLFTKLSCIKIFIQRPNKK